MSDSYLDHIPSHEREKIRRRMRSPAEYERLRERVKGPEDLEREMDKNEHIAELKFSIETEAASKESLKSAIEKDLLEKGMDAMLESADISPDARASLERGKFDVTVENNPDTHADQVMILPEGKVQEKIPLKVSLSDRYALQFAIGSSGSSQSVTKRTPKRQRPKKT